MGALVPLVDEPEEGALEGREVGEVGRAEALAAFRERRFFVVIDGSRCDDLDAPIALTTETTIRFVRILPLRGG